VRTYAERRRARLEARRPRVVVDDPENEQRQLQARANMRAFDRLGPLTREVIRDSRFDAPAEHVWRRYGGEHAEDELVARNVRRDDDYHSGRFGPAFPRGI
jgi:hypothetical protein